jgi:predicted AlkP superfamily pyrophosphatase or phosphodiesterase
LAALLLALCVALGCSDRGSAANALPKVSADGAQAPSTVILISLDGTRPADLRTDRLPSLVTLGEAGLRGELVPVNPSNTFPNHVSLATGVRPDVHRLVNNSFVDPERGAFRRSSPEDWIEAEPIWSVAERHGVPAASFYWVGSEGPWTGGPGPSVWKKFSSRTSEKTKVDQILAWLDEPDSARRPRLVTAWFHGADHAAHEYGPESPEVAEALAPQDRQIARLVQALESRGLFASTTLIFVSDHGMTTARRRVDLGAALREAGIRARVLGIGGFASVHLEQGRGTQDRVDRCVAVARDRGLEAFARNEAPAGWHVADVRFGDVVVRAPIGTAIVTSTTSIEGVHGYDPEAPEMAALIVARGRGVRAGSRVGRVSNLAVAPTVLALLGLPAPASMQVPPIEAMLVGVAGRGERGPEATFTVGPAPTAEGVR